MANGPLSFKELKDMLNSFRCQDLCNLLAFAGQSRSGKKSELIERCVQLLEKGNVQVQQKVQEIHLAKSIQLLQQQNSLINNNNNNSTTFLLNQNSNSSHSSTSNTSPNTMITHDMYNLRQPQHQQQQPNTHLNFNMPSSNCDATFTGLHSNLHSHLSISNEIKLRKLAFFEMLFEIQKPTRLIPNNPASRPYQTMIQFQIPQSQLDLITSHRELVDGKPEFAIQVQLRFSLYDGVQEQPDNMPPNLTVNVNQKPAPLPAPKPTSKPNSDIIRPGRAVDITHLCKLMSSALNKIDVYWTNSDGAKDYCCTLSVVRRLTTLTLVDSLLKNTKKSSDFSRQLAKEKLSIQDTDFEIETSTLKASLLCPLMKCRIGIPGRSVNCKHVQCFDLTSYLHMNEKKPTWNCPVCDRYAPYEDLIIDSYYSEILKKATDCEDIQFHADGNWTKVELKKKNGTCKTSSGTTTTTTSSSTSSSNGDTQKTQTIATTEVDVNESVISLTPIKQAPVERAKEAEAGKSKEIVIDLTIDSDDDDTVSDTSAQTNAKTSTTNNQTSKNKRQESEHVEQPNRKRQSSSPISVISLSSTRSNTPNTSPQNVNKQNMQVDVHASSASSLSQNLLLSIDKSIQQQQQQQQPRSPNYSPSRSIVPNLMSTQTNVVASTIPQPYTSIINRQQQQTLPNRVLNTGQGSWQSPPILQPTQVPVHPFNFSASGNSQNNRFNANVTNHTNDQQSSRSVSPNRYGIINPQINKNKYNPNKKQPYNSKDKAHLTYADTSSLATNYSLPATNTHMKVPKDLQSKVQPPSGYLDPNLILNQQQQKAINYQQPIPQQSYSNHQTIYNQNPFFVNSRTPTQTTSNTHNRLYNNSNGNNFNENYYNNIKNKPQQQQQQQLQQQLPQQIPLPPHLSNLNHQNSN